MNGLSVLGMCTFIASMFLLKNVCDWNMPIGSLTPSEIFRLVWCVLLLVVSAMVLAMGVKDYNEKH